MRIAACAWLVWVESSALVVQHAHIHEPQEVRAGWPDVTLLPRRPTRRRKARSSCSQTRSMWSPARDGGGVAASREGHIRPTNQVSFFLQRCHQALQFEGSRLDEAVLQCHRRLTDGVGSPWCMDASDVMSREPADAALLRRQQGDLSQVSEG